MVSRGYIYDSSRVYFLIYDLVRIVHMNTKKVLNHLYRKTVSSDDISIKMIRSYILVSNLSALITTGDCLL